MVIDDKPYYVIKSISMTNYLIRNGCELVKVADDKFNPKYKVFLFLDCELLRELITNFKK